MICLMARDKLDDGKKFPFLCAFFIHPFFVLPLFQSDFSRFIRNSSYNYGFPKIHQIDWDKFSFLGLWIDHFVVKYV